MARYLLQEIQAVLQQVENFAYLPAPVGILVVAQIKRIQVEPADNIKVPFLDLVVGKKEFRCPQV